MSHILNRKCEQQQIYQFYVFSKSTFNWALPILHHLCEIQIQSRFKFAEQSFYCQKLPYIYTSNGNGIQAAKKIEVKFSRFFASMSKTFELLLIYEEKTFFHLVETTDIW